MSTMIQELVYLSASAQAHAIQGKEVSSQELVEAHLQCIEQVNPQLNAVIQFAPDARERARQADQALARGENWGALHSVPLTIKDAFDTAGIISTAGTKGRAGYVPTQMATIFSSPTGYNKMARSPGAARRERCEASVRAYESISPNVSVPDSVSPLPSNVNMRVSGCCRAFS